MRNWVLVIGIIVSAFASGCDERRVLLDSLPGLCYTAIGVEEIIPGLGPPVKAKPVWRTTVPGRAFWARITIQNNTTAYWENVAALWERPEGVYRAAPSIVVDGVEQAVTGDEIVLRLDDMPSRAKRQILARLCVATKPPAAPRSASALSPTVLQEFADSLGVGSVPLVRGWNLMAVPFGCGAEYVGIERDNETKTLQEAAVAEWVAAPIWGWSGTQYVSIWPGDELSRVEPLHGYWILAAKGCRLVLPREPPPPPSFDGGQ